MKKTVLSIILIGFIGILLFFTVLSPASVEPQASNEEVINTEISSETEASVEEKEILVDDDLMDHVMSGGPPKDGIPPIDNPIYESVSDSSYLNNYDKIFVYESKDGIYLYPQRILVWHEIVNDVIDGEHVSITYCPLTGSTICYLGDENHLQNTYGTSGDLLNSNLVMYDRLTDSYIPQILGVGISGELNQTLIPTNPIHWSDWKDVKLLYPEAKVLSRETGFFRDYNVDPYGSYLPDQENSYYYLGGPLFDVLNEDDTFSDKKIVVGVKNKTSVVAIDPFYINEVKVHNFRIGNIEAVALFDENLSTVRVFDRNVNNQLITLEVSSGGYRDENGNTYDYSGKSNQNLLKTLTYFDVMWFAWYAYYPDTEVIQ